MIVMEPALADGNENEDGARCKAESGAMTGVVLTLMISICIGW
jgi:hypothetical protein